MQVTVLLCGGPLSGKTMLARVLVEMLKEQGFAVAYSEVSVPPVYAGGKLLDVGEVLVVTDTAPAVWAVGTAAGEKVTAG